MIMTDGADAVFLSGKIHSCEWQAYVIYYNAEANGGKGSLEIEIIDAERISKLYEKVGDDAEAFFGELPDWFHGEWKYCDYGSDGYAELEEAYPSADFIVGRDGDLQEELHFLIEWAKACLIENFLKS